MALTAATAVADDQLPHEAPSPTSNKEENQKVAGKTKTSEKVTEYTVVVAPFTITAEVEGILVPTKIQTLKLSPRRWKSFPIASVSKHGATIRAGEPLITFETKAIDRKLMEQTDQVAKQEIKLAIANRELAELQQRNALNLAATKRRLEHAEADLSYYESTGQPARKEELAQSEQQSKDFLSYQEEELDQLQKMYTEDDLTEETEEIILTRQKARVRDAKNSLQRRQRENTQALETSLPRELIAMQEKAENARINYATAKLNLERKYELKKLEVSSLERELTEAREELAETQQDRELFEVIAEFDGNLLYGEFTDGEWKKGKTAEFLRVGGSVPAEQAVLTLVAKDSPLSLHALMDSKEIAKLEASLTESGEQAPLVKIAPYPNLSGKHLVQLEATPADAFQFPGQKHQSDLIFYEAEEVITIPNDAIKTREDGTSYVKVKLSEGEPEEREIELGKTNQKVSEVLSGLEAGQVILM